MEGPCAGKAEADPVWEQGNERRAGYRHTYHRVRQEVGGLQKSRPYIQRHRKTQGNIRKGRPYSDGICRKGPSTGPGWKGAYKENIRDEKGAQAGGKDSISGALRHKPLQDNNLRLRPVAQYPSGAS